MELFSDAAIFLKEGIVLEQVLGCLARLAVWANSENNLFIFEMVREMLNLDLHLSLRGTFHSNG